MRICRGAFGCLSTRCIKSSPIGRVNSSKHSLRCQPNSTLAAYEKSLRVLTAQAAKNEPKRPSTLRRGDSDTNETDYVTMLQRFMARSKRPLPVFTTRKQGSGFSLCTLTVSGNVYVGKGLTEGDAENAAAELAYNTLRATRELKLAAAKKNTLPHDGQPSRSSHTNRAAGPSLPSQGEKAGQECRRPPEGSSWHDIPTALNPQKVVFAPWPVPLPRLAHGLARVLAADNSVATSLQPDDARGQPFSPYLRRIVQPEHINWEAIAPFTPASQDAVLHELAVSHGARYKASTSSITGLLSHVYQARTPPPPLPGDCRRAETSNFRPVETPGLCRA
jgi:hypothetical protein